MDMNELEDSNPVIDASAPRDIDGLSLTEFEALREGREPVTEADIPTDINGP